MSKWKDNRLYVAIGAGLVGVGWAYVEGLGSWTLIGLAVMAGALAGYAVFVPSTEQ